MAAIIRNVDWTKICGRIKDYFEGEKPNINSSR
jgi:hypothetical protein